MIKRLIIIGFLTGFGHLTTLLCLKFITKYAGNSKIALIAEIDSLSLLIISIIAFGLQLSSTRELAILDDWKEEYYSAQSARFMFSILLTIVGLSGFLLTKNFLFLIAPIIALNADYALYGLGKPISGAILSLIRTLIPSITLIVSSIYFIDYLIVLFSLSIVIAYLITGLAVSHILQVKYFVVPKFKHLIKYYENLNIGIATFASFFVGIGIINILAFFYNDEVIASSYLALKLYMIFKGVRRIIVQSFFRELSNDEVALKVDYFAIIAGSLFLSIVLFFPNTLISILFDEKLRTYKLTFIILGLAGFLSSITTSTGTRLLLLKKDNHYSWNLIIAALVTIFSGISLSYFIENKNIIIPISVLLGELVISILNVMAIKERNFLKKRILMAFPIIMVSFLFMAFKHIFGENINTLVYAIVLFTLFSLIYTKRRLKIF